MTGPNKANWNGRLGPLVRTRYDTATDRQIIEVNPFNTADGWVTYMCSPCLAVEEDWISPMKNAATTRIIGSLRWLYTEANTGDVSPANILRGGIRTSTPAQNDAVTVAQGGSATVFPIALALNPHTHVGFTTNNNDADFYWETGFYDAAGTTRFMLTYEQGAYYIRTDNGTGADNVQVIGGTPDTAHHDASFRFSDSGEACDILIDGVVQYTAELGVLAKYPATATRLAFHIYQESNKVGGGAFTTDWQHVRIHLGWE